jgi:hypothetical protein
MQVPAGQTEFRPVGRCWRYFDSCPERGRVVERLSGRFLGSYHVGSVVAQALYQSITS